MRGLEEPTQIGLSARIAERNRIPRAQMRGESPMPDRIKPRARRGSREQFDKCRPTVRDECARRFQKFDGRPWQPAFVGFALIDDVAREREDEAIDLYNTVCKIFDKARRFQKNDVQRWYEGPFTRQMRQALDQLMREGNQFIWRGGERLWRNGEPPSSERSRGIDPDTGLLPDSISDPQQYELLRKVALRETAMRGRIGKAEEFDAEGIPTRKITRHSVVVAWDRNPLDLPPAANHHRRLLPAAELAVVGILSGTWPSFASKKEVTAAEVLKAERRNMETVIESCGTEGPRGPA